MNTASVLVATGLLVYGFFVLRAIRKGKTGGCSGCTGDCSRCGKGK